MVQFSVYNTKSYLVGSIGKGQTVALGCVEGSETSEKYPVQRCPAAVAMWRGGEGSGLGLPDTYLTAGKQWRNDADGPQGQVQVLHHCSCGRSQETGTLRTNPLGALFALLGDPFKEATEFF